MNGKPEVEMVKISDELDKPVEVIESAVQKNDSELRIRFWKHDGHLVISFFPPVQNLKMTMKEAREFAAKIVKETLK